MPDVTRAERNQAAWADRMWEDGLSQCIAFLLCNSDLWDTTVYRQHEAAHRGDIVHEVGSLSRGCSSHKQ